MRLFPIGLALFILIPLLEIYLIIKVGGQIGALWTIMLIVFTAITGIALLRQQGLSTLQRVQMQVQQGQVPAVGVLEGIMLFFAGALLLTPGFFTDAIGFLLLLPPLRKGIALWILEHSGTIVQINPDASNSHNPEQPRTLEGDYQRRDDR